MTHLTGSAPYHTEELVDMIIIKMCMSIAKITLVKLSVHPPEVTSIQTNESIISQICIASERAALPIQNTLRQHPFKILGAFVILSVVVSHLESQQLFKKEKMEGDKKTSYVYILHSNSKVNVVFWPNCALQIREASPGRTTLALLSLKLSLRLIAVAAQLSFIHLLRKYTSNNHPDFSLKLDEIEPAPLGRRHHQRSRCISNHCFFVYRRCH